MRYLFLILFLTTGILQAQVFLDADGAGNTYELINSVLAPGFDAVEVPDCNHGAFGRHIDEVFDTDLNTNVFRFFIHASDDDDRCINVDRQRNEIKTYDKSPDNLKGVVGENVEYRWKFKIAAGFQPSSSFTHIHQLKAVGGTESAMPLITLTLRKATPNRLELRYAETTTQVTLTQVDLAPFEGEWVEVVETVQYGETGAYNITIKKVSDGSSLLSYSNNTIRMWKTSADFIRPKWGIYRSLNNPLDLRDEEVLFANFSIMEFATFPVELTNFDAREVEGKRVELVWQTASEINNDYFEIERSGSGRDFEAIGEVKGNRTTSREMDYIYMDHQPLRGMNYYRLKQVDFDGGFSYSDIKAVDMAADIPVVTLSPNPTLDYLSIQSDDEISEMKVFDTRGVDCTHLIRMNSTGSKSMEMNLEVLASGFYIIHIKTRTQGVNVDERGYTQMLHLH